jgi:hypothetical protein
MGRSSDAFMRRQPTASDTLNRDLARTAGTFGAILVTIAVALVAPDWVLVGFAVFAMVAGLAYLLRSPFLTAVGTTVLTVAAGFLAGTSTGDGNRLLSTVPAPSSIWRPPCSSPCPGHLRRSGAAARLRQPEDTPSRADAGMRGCG